MTINLKKQEIRHYHHRVCVLLREFTFFHYLIMCTSEREREREKVHQFIIHLRLHTNNCPHTENDVRYLSFGHDLQFFKVLSIDLRFRVCDKCWYYVTAYFVSFVMNRHMETVHLFCVDFVVLLFKLKEEKWYNLINISSFARHFTFINGGFMNNSRCGRDKNHIHQREKKPVWWFEGGESKWKSFGFYCFS